MTAVALLAQIIAQRAKVASWAIRNTPEFEQLMEYRYIRNAGVVSSLTCTECDQPHDAEVFYDNRHYGHFCPDMGFVPTTRDTVQTVVPDIPKLIQSLADAFHCKRRKASPLQDQTWRIGGVNLDQGDAMLFFHPCLRDENELRAFHDAQSREVRSEWRLIVTAEGALPFSAVTIVRLDELVELDTNDGRLVPLSNLGELVGVPVANKGGAPNRFGALLTALIENRIKAQQALTGLNMEAKAVLKLFAKEHPDLKPPSISSVKTYLTKIRAGQ